MTSWIYQFLLFTIVIIYVDCYTRTQMYNPSPGVRIIRSVSSSHPLDDDDNTGSFFPANPLIGRPSFGPSPSFRKSRSQTPTLLGDFSDPMGIENSLFPDLNSQMNQLHKRINKLRKRFDYPMRTPSLLSTQYDPSTLTPSTPSTPSAPTTNDLSTSPQPTVNNITTPEVVANTNPSTDSNNDRYEIPVIYKTTKKDPTVLQAPSQIQPSSPSSVQTEPNTPTSPVITDNASDNTNQINDIDSDFDSFDIIPKGFMKSFGTFPKFGSFSNMKGMKPISLGSFGGGNSMGMSDGASSNEPFEPQSQKNIDIYINIHNEYRRKHHSPPLVYDAQLADYAQKYAQYLADMKYSKNGAFPLQHSTGHDYGENLYYIGGSIKPNPGFLYKTAIDSWYEEVHTESYPYGQPHFLVAGHFTQVVWKESKKLGCGAAKKGMYFIVSCNYTPRGNFQFNNERSYERNVLPP